MHNQTYLMLFMPPPLYAKEFTLRIGLNTVGSKGDIALIINRMLPIHYTLDIQESGNHSIIPTGKLSEVNIYDTPYEMEKCEEGKKYPLKEDCAFFANGIKFTVTKTPLQYKSKSVIYSNEIKEPSEEKEPEKSYSVMISSMESKSPDLLKVM